VEEKRLSLLSESHHPNEKKKKVILFLFYFHRAFHTRRPKRSAVDVYTFLHLSLKSSQPYGKKRQLHDSVQHHYEVSAGLDRGKQPPAITRLIMIIIILIIIIITIILIIESNRCCSKAFVNQDASPKLGETCTFSNALCTGQASLRQYHVVHLT